MPLFEILLPLRKSNLVGLCKCIFGTEIGYDTQTATVCYYTEEGFSCRCRVDSILNWRGKGNTMERCTYPP